LEYGLEEGERAGERNAVTMIREGEDRSSSPFTEPGQVLFKFPPLGFASTRERRGANFVVEQGVSRRQTLGTHWNTVCLPGERQVDVSDLTAQLLSSQSSLVFKGW